MKVNDLWSFGHMGETHYSANSKRSVFYFGNWIGIQRLERKFPKKKTTYRYYCHDLGPQHISEDFQRRWDEILQSSIDNNSEYLIKYVHEGCYAYSEEFEDKAEAEARAKAHMQVFHPFSNEVYTRRYDLTPAWLSGSVLPRRKDIHHHDNTDAHPWGSGEREVNLCRGMGR